MATASECTDPIRVYLLEDHELARRGLRDLLSVEPDLAIVGESGSARRACAQIPPLRPDVAVFDVRLPDGLGIEVCRDVRAVDPSIRALILTSYDDENALFASILAGASGFVLKQISGSGLVDGIRLVAAGQSLLDPISAARVVNRMRNGDPERRQFDALTAHERQVLALICDGLTNRQIGDRLRMAEKTITNYVSAILAKLGLRRRAQAPILSARFLAPDVEVRGLWRPQSCWSQDLSL